MEKLVINGVDFTQKSIHEANTILRHGNFDFKEVQTLARHFKAKIKVKTDGRSGLFYRNLIN